MNKREPLPPTLPPPPESNSSSTKIQTASKVNESPELKAKTTTRPGEKLLVFVEKWRQAWQNKDLDVYMKCYSPTFTSGNLDKNGWRVKKRFLNKKYRYIKVSIDNIIVEWTGTGANVTFSQTYESDKLKTSGTKSLTLIKDKDGWVIEKEKM
jgi:murein L,D-transpeptidase YafK